MWLLRNGRPRVLVGKLPTELASWLSPSDWLRLGLAVDPLALTAGPELAWTQSSAYTLPSGPGCPAKWFLTKPSSSLD